ncbi:HvfA family oxazolone/thioamide-modified RiPP metallophore [Rheinheimera salexigens]|uniref:Low-complexity protein n=1 Tax=Rheinheimera salexigens TaxID=1628148 RepID=A0A1E7Q8N1_9GAMM|nr:hypothetical protein [Rheinheimera salexigens]OEY70545.1 hypothetical protein BI198_13965 [Rheinheimera salexigens]
MKTIKHSNVAMAVGALVFGSLATVSTSADANPFTAQELTSGYQIAASEGKCGEAKCGEEMKKKHAEKMKEGKCGEGKCGEEMMKKSADKMQEGKCGEGKCGEEMMKEHADKTKAKSKEATCGAGKTQDAKCGGAV